MVDGLMKLMNNTETIGPINLGNPHEITVKELAEIVIKLTESKSNIVEKDLPQDDPERRRPDISRANKYLKWSPSTDLTSGLLQTISYFKLFH